MAITIWHNPVCSTSRKVLDFLETKDKQIEIRNYISNPPSISEIESVLNKMHQPANYILRKKDKVFLEKYADKNLTNSQWIQAMSENPSIIERPIVIKGNNAYLARPFEEFCELF